MTLDPEVQLWLTGEIRARITELADPAYPAGGWVADREWAPPASNPHAPAPPWQVIIRDDGINDEEFTGEAALGISVLAGTKLAPGPAKRLARIVKAIVKDTARAEPGNPVVDVTSVLGPFLVDEPGRAARQYLTATLTVVS